MYINRPLVLGIKKNNQKTRKFTSRHQSTSRKPSTNNIRVKTLHSTTHPNYSQINDLSNVENQLIGLKDVREIMDVEILQLLRRIQDLEIKTEDQSNKLNQRINKIKTKSAQKHYTQSKSQNQISYSLQDQQQRTYKQCVQFLQKQQQQEQKTHGKFGKQVTIKFYYLQETIIQLQNLKQKHQYEISITKNQLNKKQQQVKLIKRRSSNKQNLLDQIQDYYKQLKIKNQKLFQGKQQSMKQKNQFIEIQAQEIKIMKNIEDIQQEQIKYIEQLEQYEYYKKLQKLRQKLLRIKTQSTQEIDDFFNQKIEKISKTRARNDQTQQQVEEIIAKIQQQQAIIQLLKKKYQQFQQIQQQRQPTSPQNQYRREYNKIFLNNKSKTSPENSQTQNQYRDLDHWQRYKISLERILKNQKKLNQLQKEKAFQNTSSFYYSSKEPSEKLDREYDEHEYKMRNSTKIKNIRKVYSVVQNNYNKNPSMMMSQAYKNTDPHRKMTRDINPMDRQPPFKNDKGKILKNNSFSNSGQKQKSRTPLPKLIKMQGRYQDSGKIKNQLTKFTNNQFDSEVQLQTVRTSQEDDDQIIEVEFKGKKSVPVNKPVVNTNEKKKLK